MSNKPGDGRRVQRVEREIQQTIAQFVLRDMKSELPGFVTISSVRMPADLKTARVSVSLLAQDGDEAKLRDEAVEILQSWAFEIQDYIASELKLRFCPKLTFQADESTHKVLKVESILHKIASEKKEK